MTAHRRFRLVRPAALALAPVLAALPAGGPARAQERGEVMRDALSGLGLLERRQDAIDYHERAPLVMPPKLDGRALPQPRARATSTAWPKDPEIVERERADAERRVPRGNQAQGRYNDNNVTMSVDEIRGGRRAGASLTTEAQDRPGDNTRRDSWLNPLELLSGKSADAEASDVEPTRDTLTQPPTGYRQAPRKVVRSTSDPVRDVNKEREEADPGAYIRARSQ